MLIAVSTLTNTRVYAKTAMRPDGPFACPVCAQPVTLKRPRVRAVAHFAHGPGSDCTCARGETPRHREVKEALYEALRAQGIAAELEHDLGTCRADVYFRHAGREIVIEVQRSRISVDDINARMHKHSAAGRAVVWVLTTPVPTPRIAAPLPAWTRYLHGLAYGMVFHHLEGGLVLPVAYRRATRLIPEREYFDQEVQEYQLAGGHHRAFLGKRRAFPAPEPVRVSDLTVAAHKSGVLVAVLPYGDSSWNRRRFPTVKFNFEIYGGRRSVDLRNEGDIAALVADRDFLTDQPIRVCYRGPFTKRLDAIIADARGRNIEIVLQREQD